MRRRVVLLGFDAADSDIVGRGIAEGWLPGMRRLAEVGRTALLDAGGMPFPSAAWTTALTGVPPQEHLLLLPQQLHPGSYLIEWVPPGSARHPPFWAHVSRAGKRSTIVGAKAIPALRPFHGTQVLGWGYPPPDRSHRLHLVEPTDLEPLVRRVAGRTAPRLPHDGVGSPRRIRRETDRLVTSATRYGCLLEELMRRTDWEFFFGSFGEAHVGGHVLWHLQRQGVAPAGVGDEPSPLVEVYRAIDSAIAALARTLPEDALLFVFTPHGMAGNPNPSDPIPLVLERGGWLARRGEREAQVADPLLRSVQRARSVARAVLPLTLRHRFWEDFAPRHWVARRDQASAAADAASIDWGATRAFPLPGDVVSHVRVNLSGREPQGTVRPGEEYRALCRDLAACLEGLAEAEGGRPVVRRTLFVEDLIGGPVEDGLPDVIVEWLPGPPVHRLRSPGLGMFEIPRTDPRTGNHRPPGFLLAAGPGTGAALSGTAGEGATAWPGAAVEASLLDVAPTLLRALGIELPVALAGSPIAGLVPVHQR